MALQALTREKSFLQKRGAPRLSPHPRTLLSSQDLWRESGAEKGVSLCGVRNGAQMSISSTGLSLEALEVASPGEGTGGKGWPCLPGGAGQEGGCLPGMEGKQAPELPWRRHAQIPLPR